MSQIGLHELREKYFAFFESKQHARIASASLLPENDPTTLFTGSGMQPMVPYLLGEKHPAGTRIVDSQKCFRSEDIEEVGDNRHTTFFEMLGNWSLGDYFKEEELSWVWEFLIEHVGLDPNNIYVTVFSGDQKNGLPRDDESVALWKKLFAEAGIDAADVELISEEQGGERGMQGGRIFYYDAKKNWWSRAGSPDAMPAGEPGGPDSEIFYEFTDIKHDESFGKQCHPNCDCGRFMEIGNSVFMTYVKQSDGTFQELQNKNIDFGGGLERIAAAANQNGDVFALDVFAGFLAKLDKLTGRTRRSTDDEIIRATRVVADHMRAAVFMISDGVRPSNTEAGYILRRLLRRAVRFADVLSVPEMKLCELAEPFIDFYADYYGELADRRADILDVVRLEEEKFRRTLKKGLREFEKLKTRKISGRDAFLLATTYGFPIELTQDLARERGLVVDMPGFETEMIKHQELSRGASEQKFKGGLADHSDMSIKYHTATHLLHQALRDVLGEHVVQKGSNITPDRLRFDFVHHEKMTAEQKQRVEEIINAKIADDLVVKKSEMTMPEAKERGALGLFEDKYAERVSVYEIGDYSIEICGGPHVDRTGALGKFSIKKEESASAGIRRIKAILA